MPKSKVSRNYRLTLKPFFIPWYFLNISNVNDVEFENDMYRKSWDMTQKLVLKVCCLYSVI